MSEVTPTMFGHLRTIYNLLESHSSEEELDGAKLTIFRGHTSKLFREAKISQSLYGKVFKLLNDVGCITTLQRGARDVQTVIVLHEHPSESHFSGVKGQRLTTGPRAATLQGRVEALEKLHGGLSIVDILIDHEDRIKRLEEGKNGKTAS